MEREGGGGGREGDRERGREREREREVVIVQKEHTLCTDPLYTLSTLLHCRVYTLCQRTRTNIVYKMSKVLKTVPHSRLDYMQR